MDASTNKYLHASVPAPKLAAAAWAVFRKDLRAELRTRYALNALLLFAVSTVVAISLGLGPIAPRDNRDLQLIQAALLWIALLFAAFTGLARAFVHEEESGTALALRLAAPAAGGVPWQAAVQSAAVVHARSRHRTAVHRHAARRRRQPADVRCHDQRWKRALVAATTLIAAIIARANARGALFAVLSFPLLIVPLAVGIRGTAFALQGEDWVLAVAPLQVLLAYTVALLVMSLFLFKSVWEA